MLASHNQLSLIDAHVTESVISLDSASAAVQELRRDWLTRVLIQRDS
jgi:hypothetical protein